MVRQTDNQKFFLILSHHDTLSNVLLILPIIWNVKEYPVPIRHFSLNTSSLKLTWQLSITVCTVTGSQNLIYVVRWYWPLYVPPPLPYPLHNYSSFNPPSLMIPLRPHLSIFFVYKISVPTMMRGLVKRDTPWTGYASFRKPWRLLNWLL